MATPRKLGSLFLALAGTGAAGGAPTSHSNGVEYAMMPLRNLSDDPGAARRIGALIEAELAARGARFVDAEDLEARLLERRVRYTDSLSVRDARALAEALHVEYILAGTVIDFDDGPQPRVALTLRALRGSSGERAASSSVALRGADFEGLLGLGKIDESDELLGEALDALLAAFDESARPLEQAARPSERERSDPPDSGWGYMLEDFDPAAVERVAILPFDNRSSAPDATVAWSEFLGDAWFRSSGVQVVEPAEVRSALQRLRVRSMRFVDNRGLAQLGRELGTRYFALGSIERFGEESTVDNDHFPEVEATVRIIDVESGRIMAAAGVRCRGDHYQSLLGLGVIRDPLGLARQTAREIVAGLGG